MFYCPEKSETICIHFESKVDHGFCDFHFFFTDRWSSVPLFQQRINKKVSVSEYNILLKIKTKKKSSRPI